MTPTRYLALIQFKSRYTRHQVGRTSESADDARKIVGHVRSVYPEAEAVFTDPHAVAFAFVDSVGVKGAWDKLNKGLSRGDQLSVLELGEQIVTQHPGLMEWNVKTRWFLPRKQ